MLSQISLVCKTLWEFKSYNLQNWHEFKTSITRALDVKITLRTDNFPDSNTQKKNTSWLQTLRRCIQEIAMTCFSLPDGTEQDRTGQDRLECFSWKRPTMII